MRKECLSGLRTAFLFSAFAACAVANGETSILVDTASAGPAISPRLYGIFLEEINTAIDGGLYAEMVRNRGFEESKPPEGFKFVDGKWRNAGGYATTFSFEADKALPYWGLDAQRGARASFSLDVGGNLTSATPRAGKLEIFEMPAGARVAITNEGYWGISAQRGERYVISLWVRASDYRGSLKVSVEGGDGSHAAEPVLIDGDFGGEWRKVTVTIEAQRTSSRGKLVITADATGTLWFDQVSMFPAKTFQGRPNGMRADIAQMIADLKPGFARFPGGCVVEGATIETAYDWKKTIGPLEDREETWNVWDYRRTHGMGMLEYLQFIEDIGASPMFVASAGQMCIYRNHTHPVPMDEMQPLAQSYIDALEYANGDASTTWGKRRIDAGREKPFNMTMLEIGNENVGAEYEERYKFVYPQIKARYPDVLALACFQQPPSVKTEMVDEHYYSSPIWFINNSTMYDGRDRKAPPVYIAEVAVTTNEGGRDRGNLRAALAEGVYLMGVERNADVVKMVSYAPLLANVNGRTPLAGSPPPWHGMIYFDSERCFGTVSYYLWKMFAENLPTYSVSTVVKASDENAPVHGAIGLGTWGTTAEFKDVNVEKGGQTIYGESFLRDAESWKTSGGAWLTDKDVFRQSRESISFATIGDPAWSDYTLSLKARKLSGDEGFLVMVGTGDEDRLWWNLGGWGNREHGIELNQTAIGQRVPGSIETGRWYDVKVELKGRSIKCYLDGVLLHDAVVPPQKSLHALAGIDQKRGELVLKVINPTSASLNASIDVPDISYLQAVPRVFLLTSDRAMDNNTLELPQRVVPTEKTIPPLSKNRNIEFPPSSFTVIRLSKQQ